MDNFRDIRVRRSNAPAMVSVLKDAGFVASWKNSTYTDVDGGCNDPNCCPQHPASWNSDAWASIVTNASGNQAHKLWVKAGIVAS